MTPMGSLSLLMRGGSGYCALALELAQRARDAKHLGAAERLGERVRYPVDRAARAPGDEPHAPAVAVDPQPVAVDHADLVGVVEDRRVLPGHALDAVVLADDALGQHEPVGLVALAGLVADRVHARRVAGVGGPVVAQRREVERETQLALGEHGLVLTLPT